MALKVNSKLNVCAVAGSEGCGEWCPMIKEVNDFSNRIGYKNGSS